MDRLFEVLGGIGALIYAALIFVVIKMFWAAESALWLKILLTVVFGGVAIFVAYKIIVWIIQKLKAK